MKVDKIEDSIGLISSKEKPLAAYLFSNDNKLKDDFIRNVSAGGLCINDITLHVTNYFISLCYYIFVSLGSL